MPPGDLHDSFQILSRHRVSRTPLDRHGKLGHRSAWTGARSIKGISGRDSHEAGVCSPLTGGGSFHVGERRWPGALGLGTML